ncbi:MAG: DUF3859 domain-containing protein [Syntrophobacterales bacterium]|jgi:hypothetical protein
MKKLMVSVAVMFLVSAMPPPSIAAEVYAIKLVEWGIYDMTKVKKATPGKIVLVDHMKLVTLTDKIPAKLGTSFGLKFVVNGHPPGSKVRILNRWLFPYPGVKNPKTGKLIHYLDQTSILPIGHSTTSHYVISYFGLASWQFTEPSELVPGPWKLQLWHGGKMFMEKTFTVYQP